MTADPFTTDPFSSDRDRPDLRLPMAAGVLALTLFAGGFGAWAAMAPLDSAAVAPGRLAADSQRKTILHREGGILREALVRDGDRVAKDAVLLRLDPVEARAEHDRLDAQALALLAEKARLEAERAGHARVAVSPDLAARLDAPEVRAMLDGQIALFETRRAAHQGQTDILRNRITQSQALIASLEARIRLIDRQAALIGEELGVAHALLRKGLEQKPRVLSLERAAVGLREAQEELRGEIARSREVIAGAELQVLSLAEDRRSEVTERLRAAERELADLSERRRAAAARLGRMEIRAPEAGIVLDLRHVTPGSAIAPNASVLDLVPADDRLVVEARVNPGDAESVHPGLTARIRLVGLNARVTPLLDGTVETVSADALEDERSGQPYYRARIALDTAADGLHLPPLHPGMPAEVLIRTGERTAWEYFVKPVRDSFARAFREE